MTISEPTDHLDEDTSKRPTVLLHCSDLHFGAGFQWERLHNLAEHIEELKPDGVVVSGDLTMRARGEQFAAARRFLDGLTAPLVVVPGNHDVPLYNVALRLTDPFHNYRKHIGSLGAAPLVLPHVSVYGMNTVNPLRHQQGIVRRRDLQAVEEWLSQQPENVWKLVVTHQHFVNIPGHGRPGVIPRAAEILERLSQAGAHAALCGHTHAAHVGSSAEFFPMHRPLVLVHAGTATSVRTRGITRVNTFNVFRFYETHFTVSGCDYAHESSAFETCREYRFDSAFFAGASLSL